MKVHLIDGSGFVYRAFHALPKLQRSDGMEVGAVRGFAEMLWRAVQQMDSTHVAVIADGGRSHRNDIYPRYKSNRPETPPELKAQFPLIDAACEAFGVATRRVSGYEADDVIATLSAKVDEHMDEVVSHTTIHSADKDFLQLISATCHIYHPIKKRPMGLQDCIDRFGVHPHQVPCAQGLIGDSTDGIPGSPWIGKVAAARVLAEHEDLDHVIQAALDGRLRGLDKRQMRAFMEPGDDGKTGMDLAKISRKLATLQIDVPLGFDFDDIVKREPDDAVLGAWLKEMEFEGLASKIEMQAA